LRDDDSVPAARQKSFAGGVRRCALPELRHRRFAIVSRTALVTMPIMLAVFALLHLKWRIIVILLCVTTVFGGLAWTTSPLLRWKAETVPFFYEKQTLATVGITSALCQEQTSCQ
jgi:hypothetical protein